VNAKDLFVVGAVGIGLYYVYKAISSVSNVATNAVNSATCAVSSGIACAIVNWTTCSEISLSGNIVLPNGAQVSANSVQIGHDCAGNVYANYQGNTYQLSASNSCGNYAATPVS
jgi:hypothetical protein